LVNKLFALFVILFALVLAVFVTGTTVLKARKAITTLPTNYAGCVSALKIDPDRGTFNGLKCGLSIHPDEKAYPDCLSSGGRQQFTSNCHVIYYNYGFTEWPRDYTECIRLFGSILSNDSCGLIIDDLSLYTKEKNSFTTLKSECLRAGGEKLEWQGGEDCELIFRASAGK
jgi:hypothetical protein